MAGMAVYLIHFQERYKHAGHYLGYSSSLEERIQAHRDNRGARLLEVVNEVGIAWSVVRVWLDGDYALEQQLKARHNSRLLCPRCNPRVADFAVEKQQATVETEGNGAELLDVGGLYCWLLELPAGAEAGWVDVPSDGPLERWMMSCHGGAWQMDAGRYRWRRQAWMTWGAWQRLPSWAIVFIDRLFQVYGNALVSREQVLAVLNASLAEYAAWQRIRAGQ